MNAWREKRKMRKINKINLTREAKAAAELITNYFIKTVYKQSFLTYNII